MHHFAPIACSQKCTNSAACTVAVRILAVWADTCAGHPPRKVLPPLTVAKQGRRECVAHRARVGLLVPALGKGRGRGALQAHRREVHQECARAPHSARTVLPAQCTGLQWQRGHALKARASAGVKRSHKAPLWGGAITGRCSSKMLNASSPAVAEAGPTRASVAAKCPISTICVGWAPGEDTCAHSQQCKATPHTPCP